MNKRNTSNMLDRLVQETLDGLRVWYPIALTTMPQNQALCAILSEDEWHRIRFDQSYYLPFQNGFFFLIDEWTESRRDGTTFDGLVLYIQTSIDSDLYEVARDTEQLYRLANIIAERNDFPKEVEDFIESFLNS